MSQKQFASGRFSRQGAFRALIPASKRAEKNREKILSADFFLSVPPVCTLTTGGLP